MISTPWSKKVIPSPSLRQKIQAFQDDKRQEMTIPWNDGNTFQFSALPKMSSVTLCEMASYANVMMLHFYTYIMFFTLRLC